MSDVLTLLHDLVAVNSVNPSLAPDGPGEGAIARFVRDWCDARRLETHWLEPIPGRPSVVAVARGAGGGRSLMLNAHLDTVGVDGMTDPFALRREGGRLYGRGALDMKSGLAACLHALARAGGLPLRGDVILTAVADEEHGSLGTVAALERFTADAAILTEPTGLDLHVAHRGFAVFEIDLRGRASHTSQPERGVNAVTHLGRVLREIEALDAALRAREPHPLLGHGSAQAVRVEGGRELFTTPDRARVSFERRTLPGESAAAVEDELRRLLERAAAGDPDFRADARVVVRREPFEVAADEEIVRLTGAAAAERRGGEPARAGAPYWMDAALIQGAGIPTVVFGPAGEGLHAADEWVEADSVIACADVLVEVIASYCA